MQQHFFIQEASFFGQKFTIIFLWTIFLQQKFFVPSLRLWGQMFATDMPPFGYPPRGLTSVHYSPANEARANSGYQAWPTRKGLWR